jgi:hypothetical protein
VVTVVCVRYKGHSEGQAVPSAGGGSGGFVEEDFFSWMAKEEGGLDRERHFE